MAPGWDLRSWIKDCVSAGPAGTSRYSPCLIESGASATLLFQGHSHDQSRAVRYDGTRATLTGHFAFGTKNVLEIHDHVTGQVERVVPVRRDEDHHGGGDAGVLASFVRAVQGVSAPETSARESLESHLMAFAAEEARGSGCRVDLAAFRRRGDTHG